MELVTKKRLVLVAGRGHPELSNEVEDSVYERTSSKVSHLAQCDLILQVAGLVRVTPRTAEWALLSDFY